MGLGPYDFAAGLPFLRALEARARFPFLCANLVDRNSGDPVFRPWVIVGAGGFRVGLVGILDSTLQVREFGDDFRLEPTFGAIKRYAQELKAAGCDLVVVLSAVDPKKLRLAAKTVDEVDLLVAGDPDDKVRLPWRIGSALVGSVAHLGRYLGHVTVTGSPGGRAALTHGLVAMKPEYPDEPAVRRLVDRYYRFAAVAKLRVPHGIVSDEEELAVNVRQGGALYVSARECARCHPDAHRQWRTQPHARALERLPPADRQRAECLECHVTGFGEWGGWAEGATVDLGGVQCEACHGPGSLHPAAPMPRSLAAAAEGCRGCHTRSRSPGFKLKEARARVDCPPGAVPRLD